MKIAFLSRYQNTVNRGAETVVKELSVRLATRHQVHILTGSDSDNIARILSGKYDYVIPMNGRVQSLKASLGRIKGKYKLVITGQSGIGRDDIWNIAIARPDLFIALTDYMAGWAKRWALGGSVVKIPNGVDIKKFSPEGGKLEFGLRRPVVLSVGALTWYKHHELAIAAMEKLGVGSLLVVGKGEDEAKIRKIGEQKLGSNFKIVNFHYESMPEVYRSADLFTLPSWNREAFGVVYLEAMASGLPVVAPDDPPRREIIGKAGILTNVYSSQMFAQAIRAALDTKWGDLPRVQAEKFSWDIVAGKYLQCLENL